MNKLKNKKLHAKKNKGNYKIKFLNFFLSITFITCVFCLLLGVILLPIGLQEPIGNNGGTLASHLERNGANLFIAVGDINSSGYSEYSHRIITAIVGFGFMMGSIFSFLILIFYVFAKKFFKKQNLQI